MNSAANTTLCKNYGIRGYSSWILYLAVNKLITANIQNIISLRAEYSLNKLDEIILINGIILFIAMQRKILWDESILKNKSYGIHYQKN